MEFSFTEMEPPPPGPPSRQQIHIEEDDSTIRLVGYEIILWRQWLWRASCILTFGILGLLGNWFPRLWLGFVTHEKAFINIKQGFVVVESSNRDVMLISLHKLEYPFPITTVFPSSFDQSSSGSSFKSNETQTYDAETKMLRSLIIMNYRYSRFALDPRNGLFYVMRNWRDSSWASSSILQSGLQENIRRQRARLFDRNEINIEVKSTTALLINEVIHPFYVFQVASVILWSLDNYYYYAFCIFAISIGSIATTLVETKKTITRMREMSKFNCKVNVMVDGTWAELDSTDLVPGDLVNLSSSQLTVIPADMFLLTGDAILNESFDTTKGALIRSMLFPKPIGFKFYRDSIRFIAVLAGIALLGFSISAVQFVRIGLKWQTILIRALDLITVVVPPALPATLSIGTSFAIARLKKSDWNSDGGWSGHSWWKDKASFLHALATCHSLKMVGGDVVGDPLDVKMFEFTRWTLEEGTIGRTGVIKVKSGAVAEQAALVQTVVRPPGSAQFRLEDALKGNAKRAHFLELGVIRSFEFVSSLRRMSVVVKRLKSNSMEVYVKGAPEVMMDICEKDSFPEDYDDLLSYYTKRGYRVIAMAGKSIEGLSWLKAQRMKREQAESKLKFLGLTIFENKIKPGTTPAIQALRIAHLPCRMITGDNPLTAVSVARECGLVNPAAYVFSPSFIRGDATGPDAKLEWTCMDDLSWKLDNYSLKPSSPPLHHTAEADDIGYHDYSLVISGDVFRWMISYAPLETLQRMLVKAQVFARMSPDEKNELLQIYFTTVTLLYSFASSLGDFQFLYIDLFIIIPIAVTMGRTSPYPRIYHKRPAASLVSKKVLSSIIGQIIITSVVQIWAYSWVRGQEWYTPPPSPDANDDGNQLESTNFENSVLFLISCFQYILVAGVFSIGPPYRKPMWTNVLLMFSLAALTSFNLLVLLSPPQAIADLLTLMMIPTEGFGYLAVAGIATATAQLSTPTTLTTVTSSMTPAGPLTQTCVITLTPITDSNGKPAVQEVKNCTVAVNASNGTTANTLSNSPASSSSASSSNAATAASTTTTSAAATAESSTSTVSPATSATAASTSSVSANAAISVNGISTMTSLAPGTQIASASVSSSASDSAAAVSASSAAATSVASAGIGINRCRSGHLRTNEIPEGVQTEKTCRARSSNGLFWLDIIAFF
ncbi:Ca-transporting ATPase [Lentinula edodes]|uniref:Cation-transporting ATPase n=1 Tax=Lentinula edodes TaxID=5353 RepID=A0A1Q3EE03_LENED|nr:Ca-transporting ATPase [Lentinula edodes]